MGKGEDKGRKHGACNSPEHAKMTPVAQGCFILVPFQLNSFGKGVKFRIKEVEDDLLLTFTLAMCQAIVSNCNVTKCFKIKT